MNLTKTDKIFLKTIGGASLALAFANAAIGPGEKLMADFARGAVVPALLVFPWAYLKASPHVRMFADRLFPRSRGSQRDNDQHLSHH